MEAMAASGDLLWHQFSPDKGEAAGLERGEVERCWREADGCVVEGSVAMLPALEAAVGFPLQVVYLYSSRNPEAGSSAGGDPMLAGRLVEAGCGIDVAGELGPHGTPYDRLCRILGSILGILSVYGDNH